ncbi:MAG: hypothetical protein R3C56_41520 [Pirellulaceae bacterium]
MTAGIREGAVHVSQQRDGLTLSAQPAWGKRSTLAKFVELVEDLIPQIELLVDSDAPAAQLGQFGWRAFYRRETAYARSVYYQSLIDAAGQYRL